MATGTDDSGQPALRLWRKISVQTSDWTTVNGTASTYWATFNTKCAGCAFKSGLLSITDIQSGWLNINYVTGFSYWLRSTTYDGYHEFVFGDGSVAVNNNNDNASRECLPYVWIH